MTVSPTPTYGAFGTRSKTSTSPPPPLRTMPTAAGFVRSVAVTALWPSVSSVTRDDARSHALSIVPTSRLRCDHDVAGRDAVIGAGGDRDALVDRALRIREDRGVHAVEVRERRRPLVLRAASFSCTFSCTADSSWISCWRSVSTCARSFLFSDFASTSPCAQPAASRNGRETRSAATSKGRRIDAAVPCTPSSALERNETVIRTSESSTRPPTMIRRLRALERLEG